MIIDWLGKFADAWIGQDVDGVIQLFTPDVAYWEGPFKKLDTLDDIRKEWQAITKQEKIKLEMKTVLIDATDDNLYSVRWNLKYVLSGIPQEWAGLYTIKLNEAGLCSYFWQVGEEKK